MNTRNFTLVFILLYFGSNFCLLEVKGQSAYEHFQLRPKSSRLGSGFQKLRSGLSIGQTQESGLKTIDPSAIVEQYEAANEDTKASRSSYRSLVVNGKGTVDGRKCSKNNMSAECTVKDYDIIEDYDYQDMNGSKQSVVIKKNDQESIDSDSTFSENRKSKQTQMRVRDQPNGTAKKIPGQSETPGNPDTSKNNHQTPVEPEFHVVMPISLHKEEEPTLEKIVLNQETLDNPSLHDEPEVIMEPTHTVAIKVDNSPEAVQKRIEQLEKERNDCKKELLELQNEKKKTIENKKSQRFQSRSTIQEEIDQQSWIQTFDMKILGLEKHIKRLNEEIDSEREKRGGPPIVDKPLIKKKPQSHKDGEKIDISKLQKLMGDQDNLESNLDNFNSEFESLEKNLEQGDLGEYEMKAQNIDKGLDKIDEEFKKKREELAHETKNSKKSSPEYKEKLNKLAEKQKKTQENLQKLKSKKSKMEKRLKSKPKIKKENPVDKPVVDLVQNLQENEKIIPDKAPITTTTTTTIRPITTKKILTQEPTDTSSKEISDLEKRLEQLDIERDAIMAKVKSLKNSREEYERRVEANNITNHVQNVPGLQDTDPNVLKSFENKREIHNKRQYFNKVLQDHLNKMKIISEERKEVEAKLIDCKAKGKIISEPPPPPPPAEIEDKSQQINKISNNLHNLEVEIKVKEKELKDLENQRNGILGQQKQFYLTIKYIVRFGSQEGDIIKSIDGYLEALNSDMAFEKDKFVYNSELSSMLERIHQIMNEIRRYQIYLIEIRQKGLKKEIEIVDKKLSALFAQKRSRCHSLKEFSVKFVTRFGSQNEEIVEKIEAMMGLFTSEQDTHDQIQYLHQRLQALISKISQLNRKKEELQKKMDTDASINTEKMMSAVVRDIKNAEDQRRLLHLKLKDFNNTYTIKFGEDQSLVAQQIEDFLDKLNQYKIRFEWLEHIHLCLLKIYKLLAEKSELELLIRALREESVQSQDIHKILHQIHLKEGELQKIEREKDNDVAEVKEFKIKYITRFGAQQEDIINKIETIMDELSEEDIQSGKSTGYNNELHNLEIRILKLKNEIRDLKQKLKSGHHPPQKPNHGKQGHPKQKANLNKLSQEIRNLKEKLDKMNKSKELLQAKLYKWSKLREYEEKLEKLKEEGQSVHEELENIKNEREILERQKNILEKEKRLALLVKRSEEENSKLLQIKQQIAQLEAEIKQLNEQIYVKGYQAEGRHEGWRQLEEEMVALNKERDHTAKLIKNLYDQKKSLETKPDHLKVEQINTKLQNTDKKIKLLANEQEKSEEELLRIKVERETAEKKMADLEGLQEANHREQETIKNRRSLGDDKNEDLQRLDRELMDSRNQWELEYEAVKGLKAKYEELEELSKKLSEEKRLAEEETQILRAALETSLNEAQRNKEAEASANEDKEKILEENRRLQAKLDEEEEEKRMGLEKMKADSDRNLKKKLSKITKVKEQDEQKSQQLKDDIDEAREKAENIRKEKTEAERRARNEAIKDAKVTSTKKDQETANRNYQNDELKKATDTIKADQDKMNNFDDKTKSDDMDNKWMIKEQDDQFSRMTKENDRFQDNPKSKNDENTGMGRLSALNSQKDKIDRGRNRLMEDSRQAERKPIIKMDQAEDSFKNEPDVLSFDTLTKKVTEDVPENPTTVAEDPKEKSRQEMILKKEEELRKAMRERRKEAMSSRALRKELGELQKKLDDLKKKIDQHEKMTKVKERDERLARKLKPFTAAEEAKCKKEKAVREAEAKNMAAQKSDLDKKQRKLKSDCDAADKRLNALMDYEQKAQRDREIARQMEFQKEAEQMAQNRRNIEKQEREKKLQQQMRMEAKKIQDVGSQIERRENAREREENRRKKDRENENSRKASSSDRRARLEKERRAALSKKQAEERQRKNSYQGIMGMDTSDMLGTDLLGSALHGDENDGEKGGFAIPLDMKLDAELQQSRVNFNDDESSLRPPGGPREPLTDQMRGRAIQVFQADENGKTVDSEITDSSAASVISSKSSAEDTKNEDLYGLIPKDEFDSTDNNNGKTKGAEEILKPSKS